MSNWKVNFGLATGLALASATTPAAADNACKGVFEAKVPFCLEECGQDKSLLAARRGVLSATLADADVNGDGRVAIDVYTTARQDESQPKRFVEGRGKFLVRESGRFKGVDVIERRYAYTTDSQPYGIVRAADSAAQLKACPRLVK